MQRTALRASADAERWADPSRTEGKQTQEQPREFRAGGAQPPAALFLPQLAPNAHRPLGQPVGKLVVSHRLRVTDPSQLNEQVQGWLRRSYRLMGMQGRLETEVRSSRGLASQNQSDAERPVPTDGVSRHR